MNKYIYTGLLALVLILTSTHSFAKFTITPGIDVKGEYNDNIYLADTAKEDDFITTLAPDIRLKYSPNSSLDLSLDYGLDLRNYSRHSNLSEETHRMEMSASAKPFKRVFIDVADTYTRVPIDIRNKYASDNTITNMTDSNSFSVSTSVVLPVTTAISTTAGYNYSNLWFKDKGSTDSETHSVFFVLNDKFSSKITGALKYNYSAYRPNLTGQQGAVVEYDKHDGSVAINYQIASNFWVDGEMGESWIDFDNRDNSRMTFWNVGADYNLKIISGSSIGINYSRSLNDSLTLGASRNDRSDLFLRAGNILKLTVNPYFSENTFINTDRKDKIKGINGDVSLPVSGKVTLLLNGLWEDQKFLPGEEKVRRHSLGCSFNYKLSSKMTAGVGYRYNRRNSNIDTEDFNNNIGWLQAKVSF
ncbi:hypothetical protein BMS3Bbin09_00060 [bacterium BMS3Bbin09]|nr:hypothetical protein BMS3Bbin09_00060 [bacterium BMS3Bbin09]